MPSADEILFGTLLSRLQISSRSDKMSVVSVHAWSEVRKSKHLKINLSKILLKLLADNYFTKKVTFNYRLLYGRYAANIYTYYY